MENNIIKDRIQDVRERFLSGNQIEEIRQNVTSLVNERLDEFQNAQNNAFKELEVAIDKLENHQREMIAYFNKQLIALEEEQKASNNEVLKLASIQNFNLSKSPKNKDNVLSKNLVPKYIIIAPIAPINIANKGLGVKGSAVIATKPARAPAICPTDRLSSNPPSSDESSSTSTSSSTTASSLFVAAADASSSATSCAYGKNAIAKIILKISFILSVS